MSYRIEREGKKESKTWGGVIDLRTCVVLRGLRFAYHYYCHYTVDPLDKVGKVLTSLIDTLVNLYTGTIESACIQDVNNLCTEKTRLVSLSS